MFISYKQRYVVSNKIMLGRTLFSRFQGHPGAPQVVVTTSGTPGLLFADPENGGFTINDIMGEYGRYTTNNVVYGSVFHREAVDLEVPCFQTKRRIRIRDIYTWGP